MSRTILSGAVLSGAALSDYQTVELYTSQRKFNGAAQFLESLVTGFFTIGVVRASEIKNKN